MTVSSLTVIPAKAQPLHRHPGEGSTTSPSFQRKLEPILILPLPHDRFDEKQNGFQLSLE